jgi:hypothetical protein
MANHSPEPNNYIDTKKTFAEAMEGSEGTAKSDAKKDTSDKGEAAKNGGGKK